MYSTLSAEWDTSIRASGARASKLTLYYDGSAIATDIAMSDYSISVDRRSAIRSSGSVTVTDPAILAEVKSGSSPFEPYGSELKLEVGVVHRDDTTELIPLGFFQIESLSWSEGDSAINLDLVDRSAKAQRIETDLPITPGVVTVQSFVSSTFATIYPTLTAVSYDASLSSTKTFPGGTTYEGNYLDIIQRALSVINAEGYFDKDGNFVAIPVPYVPSDILPGDQDWDVDAGEDGVLLSAQRSISRTDTRNRVVVIGGPPTGGTVGTFALPVQVVVRDTDPTSPTYVNGPFGVASVKIERQELVTLGEVTAFATTYLRNSTGLSRSVDLTHIMNPALEAGDIVKVTYLDDSFEYHLVDKVDFGSGWSSSIQTRVKQGGV